MELCLASARRNIDCNLNACRRQLRGILYQEIRELWYKGATRSWIIETQPRSASRPSMSISCRRSVRIALGTLVIRSSMVLSITFISRFLIVISKISRRRWKLFFGGGESAHFSAKKNSKGIQFIGILEKGNKFTVNSRVGKT